MIRVGEAHKFSLFRVISARNILGAIGNKGAVAIRGGDLARPQWAAKFANGAFRRLRCVLSACGL
jgi:hypothetical protein